MSDDAKKKILARRATFVAAALASLASDGCGKTDGRPGDNGSLTRPMVCLEPPPAPDPPPPPHAPRDGGEPG